MQQHFWPRVHRPDLAADLDFDRPCLNCGYNLRGLPEGIACPECSSIRGWNLADEPIPWDEQRGLGSFLATVFLVMLRPHSFARQVWRPVRLDAPAAREFRRIMLLLAAPILIGVTLTITARAIGWEAAAWTSPFSVACVVLWVNAISLEPIAFVKDKTGPKTVRRAEILAHYVSATFLLIPLQLPLLYVTWQVVPLGEDGWLIAAGLHLALLALLLLPGVLASSWLLYELVEVTPSRAMGFTTGRAMTALASALPMMIGVPALAAAVANAAVNG